MSVDNFVSIEPCYDGREGANDYSLMQQIGLPEKWIGMVRAMEARRITWIGVREYYWTPDDWFPGMPIPDDELSEIQRKSKGVFFHPIDKDLLADIRSKTGGCFYSLTLAEQTSVLSVPLSSMQASRKWISNKQVWCLDEEVFERVEDAAIALLGREGWHGLADEGAACHVIVSLFARAIERDTREQICGLLPDDRAFPDPDSHWQAIDEYIATRVDDDWICRELHFNSDWAVRSLHNKGTIASIKAVWHGLGAAFFKRFFTHHFKYARSGLSGWPDATLWKGEAVRFVEVKHRDRLHRNQAYWIRNYARPMELDVSVLRFGA
jgi:hypothetical protein